MQDDQVRYWQDLTENYRQMSDRELLELSAKPEDLTEVAQQVLRDEMRMRRLTLTAPELPTMQKPAADIYREPISYRYEFLSQNQGDKPEGPHEYTWKTKLCDCESGLQTMHLAEALKRAGIDSWIQGAGSSGIMDLAYPRILVAADQLEQAQAVMAQPIPQDIIDEWNQKAAAEPQEFEVPPCPKCGAPDPLLDSVEPVNAWYCEACGAEWTDSEPESIPDSGEQMSSGS